MQKSVFSRKNLNRPKKLNVYVRMVVQEIEGTVGWPSDGLFQKNSCCLAQDLISRRLDNNNSSFVFFKINLSAHSHAKNFFSQDKLLRIEVGKVENEVGNVGIKVEKRKVLWPNGRLL